MSQRTYEPELLIGAVVLFLLAGLVAYLQFGDLLEQVRGAFFYQPVKAVILKSQQEPTLAEGASGKQIGVARITYRYLVNGQSYQTDRVAFSRPKTPQDVAMLVKFYEEGSEVTAYYDPDNPATAILDRAYPNMAQALWSLVFIFALPVILLVIGWPRRRREGHEPSPEPQE